MVLTFLMEKEYLEKNMSTLVIKQKKKVGDNDWWNEVEGEAKKQEIEYFPAGGQESGFIFKGEKVYAWLNDGELDTEGFDNQVVSTDSILILIPKNNSQIMRDIIEAAVDYSVKQDSGLISIYEVKYGDEWSKVQ